MSNVEVKIHKTWFKCLFNPILRCIQFWTKRPYVIVSKINKKDEVIGYGFRKIRLLIVTIQLDSRVFKQAILKCEKKIQEVIRKSLRNMS